MARTRRAAVSQVTTEPTSRSRRGTQKTTRWRAVIDHIRTGGFDGRTHTLKEISERSGVLLSYLAHATKGELATPGVDKVYAIARAYEIPLDEMVAAVMDPDAPLPVQRLRQRQQDPCSFTEQEVEVLRAVAASLQSR